jgi:hypothetical protein
MKKDKMGRACNMNVGEQECICDISGKARGKGTVMRQDLCGV